MDLLFLSLFCSLHSFDLSKLPITIIAYFFIRCTLSHGSFFVDVSIINIVLHLSSSSFLLNSSIVPWDGTLPILLFVSPPPPPHSSLWSCSILHLTVLFFSPLIYQTMFIQLDSLICGRMSWESSSLLESLFQKAVQSASRFYSDPSSDNTTKLDQSLLVSSFLFIRG